MVRDRVPGFDCSRVLSVRGRSGIFGPDTRRPSGALPSNPDATAPTMSLAEGVRGVRAVKRTGGVEENLGEKGRVVTDISSWLDVRQGSVEKIDGGLQARSGRDLTAGRVLDPDS